MAYGGREIPKSPFKVAVNEAKKETHKIVATGPGLEPGVRVGKPTHFDIHAPSKLVDFLHLYFFFKLWRLGRAPLEVAILDDTGKQDSVQVEIHPVSDGVYQCSYVAHKPGLHSVSNFFAI